MVVRDSESNKETASFGIDFLEELGLTHVRLERRRDGSFKYLAWTTPSVDGNGSPKITKHGIARTKRAG
jgi:hypothetical protein